VIADETMRPALARVAHAAPAETARRARAATLHAPAMIAGEPQDETDETTDANDICRSCGACCSYSADWPRFSLESEADLARIPPELIDEGQGGMRCTGTRCAALLGTVARSTACAIYEARPDVCRACVPGDGACREARRHFGL
jgi:uncharacterized protein